MASRQSITYNHTRDGNHVDVAGAQIPLEALLSDSNAMGLCAQFDVRRHADINMVMGLFLHVDGNPSLYCCLQNM